MARQVAVIEESALRECTEGDRNWANDRPQKHR